MVQGIFGNRGAYGAYGTYGAYRGYSADPIARAAGVGPVGQVGPVARAAASQPMAVRAGTAVASIVQPMAVGASNEASPIAQPMAAGASSEAAAQPGMFFIPDPANNKYTAPEMAVRNRILPYQEQPTIEQTKNAKPEQALQADGMEQLKDAECQTCKERKYQDGSDDASVSFQSPRSIDSSVLAATVRGHEMEHVHNEQVKAAREGRKVVSQSVTLHSAICPDCGETYISGGTTRTVTKVDNSEPLLEQPKEEDDSSRDDRKLAA